MKLSFGRAIAATALLLTLVATPCFGQGGRGGRQGGFGGGRQGGGGPGGMGMMGGGMMGGDMMLLGLLRIEEVQKEIDLMPDQAEAVTKINEKLREMERPEAGFNFREATEEQRNEFMAKMRAFSEEQGKMVSENLEEVLLPEQLERVREIALQQQGFQAFSDPTFIKKIGLTEDQQAKLKEQQESMREKMMTAMREAMQSGDREAIRGKMEEVRDSALKDAKGVLTPDQAKQYEKMLGKPFEMPESAMRGGFGGGGGRGGDRGDRGDRGQRGRGQGDGNDA